MAGLISRVVTEELVVGKEEVRRARCLSQEELGAILREAGSEQMRTLFLFAVVSGLRRGEIVALRWADLEGNVLAVSRSVTMPKQGPLLVKEPKTPAGIRQVRLDAATMEMLRAHRKTQSATRLRVGNGWQNLDLVFCAWDGSVLTPNAVTHAFVKAARRAQVQGRFHDLRHTSVTQLLQAGENLKVVQERIGHGDRYMTMRYAHALPAMAQQAADAIGAFAQGWIRVAQGEALAEEEEESPAESSGRSRI